jgi:hypothetical protein
VDVGAHNDMATQFATNRVSLHKEGLYVLASICITDKTFGELSLSLDKIESIPRSMELREIMYRIRVVNYRFMVLANNGANPNSITEGVIHTFKSPRIESDDYMAAKDFEVDEEHSVHLEVKDLFGGGGDDYMSQRAITMNTDDDIYVVLELVGYGPDNKVEYVLGEKRYTVFNLIHKQLMQNKEIAKQTQAALKSGAKPTGKIINLN